MKEEKKKTQRKNTTKKTTKKETIKKVEKETKKVEETKTLQVKKVDTKHSLEEMFGISYRTIITIVIATLLFIGLAVCLATFIKSKPKSKIDNDSITIQYSEILLGNLLDQKEQTYYVFVYNSDDNYIDTYNTYLSNYKTKEGALKVYTAALDNGFNKKFLSEEKNLYVSSIDELKLMGTTLIKVENKKVVEAYDGKDSIISHLKQLVG